MQFADPQYSNLYACGDIADSGAHKAARPGSGQAAVVAQNIASMVQGGQPSQSITVDPPAIHISLGLVRTSLTRNNTVLTIGQTKNMVFRNPGKGQTEPMIIWRDE
jgi:NADH dehydrogenase FAD-containing subunit